MTERRRIIIDTDPGCDDTVAMLLAFAATELEVLGITTTYGNVPLAQASENALKICELANRTAVPVHAGCSLPFLRPLRTAEDVHGPTGLADLTLPQPIKSVESRHGVDFLIDTLLAEPPGSVTLCALGPLTNLATAMVKDRRIVPRIREVVSMGGAFHLSGNSGINPVSEFNYACDPHAAEIVFTSGVKFTLAPLDLTHCHLASPQRIAAIRQEGSRVCGIVADILAYYSRFDIEKLGLEGAPLHDPCAIAWLIAPHLFQTRDIFVEIETGSPKTFGMTVGDWWNYMGRTPNTTVLQSLDPDGFYDLLTERLATV